ncbi:5-oxoprolinase subunit PxpA [Tamlana flava]|uniref:5-oxoprolinase subunit PxpA n=1 Tax=Tamlana flava TaxID=3158572 RepID=UPI00351BD123
MEHQIIDINVDMGEGLGNEAQLMPYISSCNIACGGHAGDYDTMKAVVKLAKQNQVKIGAHPSFPDRENFGRKIMDMPCVELFTSIKNQIKNLIVVLDEEHLQLHHVKPHGALYNLVSVDERTAKVIVEVMKALMLPAELYVPYNSVMARLAIEHNIPVFYEAFADRNYNDNLTLVARTEKNALIEDEDAMFEHVYNAVVTQKIKTVSGELVSLRANTFCIHGDNPNAVQLVRSLVDKLQAKGIKIR